MATSMAMSPAFAAARVVVPVSSTYVQCPQPARPAVLASLASSRRSSLGLQFRQSAMTQASARFTVAVMASEEASAELEPTPTNKLYVGNLPFTIDSAQLGDAFSEYGNVENADVVFDPKTGRSRGYGFITFATVEEAQNAITELDGADFGGRTIRVSFPTPRSENGEKRERRDRPRRQDAPGSKVYVGNLSWSTDDQSLGDIFSEYGDVVNAKVITDMETGRSKGFGFVTFSSSNEADSAVAQLDGQNVDGRVLRVNIAEDKKRSPRF